MKSITLVSLAGVILLRIVSQTCLAQDQAKDTLTRPDEKTTTRVAVIDIEYILQNYMPLEPEFADLVDEAKELAEQVAKEQAAIDKKRESLQMYKVDTPQHQQITQEVAKAEAVLRASAETKRAVYRRREARLYYKAYEEIRAALETFTRGHGIALVLSYDMKQPDLDSPEDIERAIRNPVIYQNRLNITPLILEAITDKISAEEKGKRPFLFHRSIEEIRAAGLRLPFYR
jgi:Skp family chaperone for outer membrane proteins